MLWNYYSESLPGPPIALRFPWSNLWPTLSLHHLCCDHINPEDTLTSPLLQFCPTPTPRHLYTLCSSVYCLQQTSTSAKWPIWYRLNFYLIHWFCPFLLFFHHKFSRSPHFLRIMIFLISIASHFPIYLTLTVTQLIVTQCSLSMIFYRSPSDTHFRSTNQSLL